MANLSELSPIDKAHWILHLNAVTKDTPSVKKDAQAMLDDGELPDIKHPVYIHNWIEEPENRAEIEAWHG